VVAQTYCAFGATLTTQVLKVAAGVVKEGVRTPSGSGRVFGSLS
jgi:hypothetical protein